MTLEDLIVAARSHSASDLHLTHDQPPPCGIWGSWSTARPRPGEGAA